MVGVGTELIKAQSGKVTEAQSKYTDPKILKVRQAIKSADIAEKHLNQLKETEINLQEPQVIVIGLE